MASNSRGECKFFNTIQGCHAVGCGFAHTLIPGISYCQFFNTVEGCRRGNSCGFIHSPLAGPRSMPSPLPSPYSPGLSGSRGHRPPRPFVDHRKNGQLNGLANPPSTEPTNTRSARLPSFAPSTVHPHVNLMEALPIGLPGGGYRTSNTKNPNPLPQGTSLSQHNAGPSTNHNDLSVVGANGTTGANGGLSLSVFEEPLNNPRFNQLCHFFNTAQGCKYGNDCGYMHKIIKKNVTVCHFFGSAKGCQAPSCGFVHNMTLYQQ